MNDYASLLTSLANWVHRTGDSVFAAVAPDCVSFAEDRVYRDLRVAAMEDTFSSVISNGVISLPTGYLELKNARIDGSSGGRLERKDAEWIYAKYPNRSAGSLPKFIAREGQNMIFGPYPDGAYTVKGSYYKRLTALSVSNTTNWLITAVPDLLLFASLCEAAPFLVNDARVPMWEAKYKAIKDEIQLKDRQEEFSGSPIAATTR